MVPFYASPWDTLVNPDGGMRKYRGRKPSMAIVHAMARARIWIAEEGQIY